MQLGDKMNNSSEIDGNFTLTDLKENLLSGKTMDRPKPPRETSEDEKLAIQNFQDNDKQMDELIDQINVGIIQTKDKAKIMGDKIDHTTMQIDKLD